MTVRGDISTKRHSVDGIVSLRHNNGLMSMRVALWVALAATTGVPDANSAVSSVRDYRLQPPRDRHIVCAMALTPNQDVLSFIADKEGKWRLSRVHGWVEEEPHEDRTVVPGLVYGDREQWNSPWSPELLVTPDGKFVVCVASAWRSQGRGQDEFVSVVSLTEFKVVASVHTPAIQALRGDYRIHRLDGRGHLVVQAYTPFPRHPGDDITAGASQVRMAVLSLPGLAVIDECEYSEWIRTGSPVRREGEGSCVALLANNGGSASLSEFISGLVGNNEMSRTNESRRPPQCAFLGYARYVSDDGRYEREICQTSHRGFWGNPVVTKSVENIFSVNTGERVGSVNDPISSVRSRFASVGGREYLLVMEGGTRLMVYLISD